MSTCCRQNCAALLACVATIVVLAIPAVRAWGGPTVGAQVPVQNAKQEPSSKPVTIDIDCAYGTLGFRGTVERIDLGQEYEFRTHIAITFRPSERTNRTPVADLRLCELVATVPGEPGTRASVLSRETQAIAVVLREDGETKPMPDLTFRLPKSIAAQARHVGLGVTDGRILWPIPTELR